MNLREEIIRLGPWHMDVEVADGITTKVSLDADYPKKFGGVSFINPKNHFTTQMKKIYPDGLKGRSFLDCACNCGGYSFWAHEIGADSCFGFDVRDHWIDQAEFLKKHRSKTSNSIQFGVHNLGQLPTLNLKPFDVTLFKGIFYHLPNPISGLKIAADLTKEVLILNSAVRNGYEDGLLVAAKENVEPLMSGVYGLNWFPTGPRVLAWILNWMGFIDVRCAWWAKKCPDQPKEVGRIEMIASRIPGLLNQFPLPNW